MKTQLLDVGQEAPQEKQVPPPFLTGERVRLRMVCRADAPKLLRWINDPETNRYLLRGDFPMGWDDEIEWIDKIAKRKEGDLHLGIEADGLGLIGLTSLKVECWINQTGVTGTAIGPEGRGQGFGTEAKMIMLRHAFFRLNLRKVYSNVIAPNERSLRCQKRCGYIEEGRFADDVFRDGAYHDLVCLAVTRERFERAEAAWLAARASRQPAG